MYKRLIIQQLYLCCAQPSFHLVYLTGGEPIKTVFGGHQLLEGIKSPFFFIWCFEVFHFTFNVGGVQHPLNPSSEPTLLSNVGEISSCYTSEIIGQQSGCHSDIHLWTREQGFNKIAETACYHHLWVQTFRHRLYKVTMSVPWKAPGLANGDIPCFVKSVTILGEKVPETAPVKACYIGVHEVSKHIGFYEVKFLRQRVYLSDKLSSFDGYVPLH